MGRITKHFDPQVYTFDKDFLGVVSISLGSFVTQMVG